MLPPQTEDYASNLHKKMLDLQRTKIAPPPRERKLDYVKLLSQYFETFPPANLNRRWTMHELCNQLSGRYAKKPAPRIIAAALRQLGFTEHRDWSIAGRNRRYWLPSTTSLNRSK